jgi:hypothetical protein
LPGRFWRLSKHRIPRTYSGGKLREGCGGTIRDIRRGDEVAQQSQPKANCCRKQVKSATLRVGWAVLPSQLA